MVAMAGIAGGDQAIGPLVAELFAQDAFVEAVPGIEKHPHRNGLVGQDFDAADVAGFVVIGHRRHRALVAFEHLDRKSTRLNSSHLSVSRMPSSA